MKLNRKTLLIAGATLLLAGGSIYAFQKYGLNSNQTTPDEYPLDNPGTDPEQNKQKIIEDQEQRNNTSSADKKKVVPEITFVGQRDGVIDVRSYVPGIYESTGTCTATFTKGDQKVVRKVEASKDATYTRCNRIAIPKEDFPSTGEWTVIIEYSSPTASGISKSRQLTVS